LYFKYLALLLDKSTVAYVCWTFCKWQMARGRQKHKGYDHRWQSQPKI